MPSFVIEMIVNLVIKFGLPVLIKKFPGLPKELWEIIEEILKYIKDSEDHAKDVAKIRKAVRTCTGTGCDIGLKGNQ